MGSIGSSPPLSLSLQWTQTRPGIYERSLDSLENFYHFISRTGQGRPEKSNWSCTAGIKVKTDRPASAFVREVKEAWKKMRLQVPTLAASIQHDSAATGTRWIYRAANRSEWDAWLQETFHVHDFDSDSDSDFSVETGRSVGLRVRSARQMYPLEDLVQCNRAVLHVFPRTQEIVLVAPHTHVDGLGMALFLNQLLRLLVVKGGDRVIQPPCGTEAANLVPGLAVTAQVPNAMTAAQKEAYENSMQEFMAADAIKLRTRDATKTAGKTRLRWLTLEPSETKQLANRCKELGFSVTAALQAAVSRTARCHCQTLARDHAIMAIYDGRTHVNTSLYPLNRLVGPHVFVMPAVFNVARARDSSSTCCSPQIAASKNSTKLVMEKGGEEDNDDQILSFVDTAKGVRDEFLRFKDGDIVRAASSAWARDTTQFLSTISVPPLSTPKPTPADLNFSSMGVLDRYIETVYHDEHSGRADIEVQDLFLTLDLMHPNVLVDVWTFRGRLNIELIYNETFHSEESIDLMASSIHHQLAQGLGLDLEFRIKKQGDEEWLQGI